MSVVGSRRRFFAFGLSFPRILILLQLFCCRGVEGSREAQGPRFATEPPATVEFVNGRGGRADCAARGDPQPSVAWLGQDGAPVPPVPGLRRLLANGSLHFPPFEPDAFRQDVHRAVYRCLLANSAGSVVSRDVAVRAVVDQKYEAEVQSPSGFLYGDVLFRCHVPPFVKDYVSVTSWLQQPAFNIYPSPTGDGKYHMFPTGELLVSNVTRPDADMTYRCRTLHRLTQEASVSRNEGRIRLEDDGRSVPPILNEKAGTVAIGVGETVVVPCVAYASPRPAYRWFAVQGGREIAVEGQERFSVRDGVLTIVGAKREDSGAYRCVASNSEGSETLQLQLTVTSPLSVSVHPAFQTVHLGRAVVLECKILGFPWTSVVWMKDGRSLKFDSRVRQRSNTTVEISFAEKEDRGMYQCLVKNEAGTSQGAAELRLGEELPQIIYRFIEQTMQPGPSVSLKCSASGNPTPQVSWFLDGFPLVHSERLLIGQHASPLGDVISHVNVSSVKAEDGGEYECVAENRAGKARHSARLNVYGAPYVRPMSPVSAVAGRELIIKCPVSGYPIAAVTWEKEGVRLPATARQRVFDNVLAVENLQRDADQGRYTCSARNQQGDASRRSVDVRVIAPPKIAPFTFARDLTLGDRISVQCVVVSGDLPLTFLWLKDGRPPAESETLAVRRYDPFTSALTIGAIAPTHSGNYTCRAANEAAVASHTSPLLVNVPPRISPFRFEDRVVTGMRTQIMCLASQGDRPFHFSWIKDGRPISDSDLHVSDFAPFSSILTIDGVALGHSGNYTCTVSNEAGRAQYTAALLVTVPPFWVVEPLREQSAVLGEPVSLHCRADGFPKPKITWKRATGGEQPGPEEYREVAFDAGSAILLDNDTLVIPKAAKKHEGYYMCEASNGVGAGKSKFVHLSVHAAPRFSVGRRQETVSKGEEVRLKCEAEGDLPMEVSWNVRGLRMPPGSDRRYVVKNTNLTKGVSSELTFPEANGSDRGEYECRAENAYGRGKTAILLAIRELPATPRNLRAEAESGRSVALTWSPPTLDGEAEVTGYVLRFKEAREAWHEHNSRKEVAGDRTGTSVTGLRPATGYHFRLFAENESGTSPPSEVASATTEAEPPGGAPREVAAEAVASTSVRVTWQPPEKSLWNGNILGYGVGFRRLGDDAADYNWTYARLPVGLPGDFRLSRLSKFTKYSVVVAAKNEKGDGPASAPLVVETMEDVPSEPPRDVRCIPLGARALQVSWRPPPAGGVNGILQGYKIAYETPDEPHGGGSRATETTSAGSVVLRGLQPYTNYSLQALAFTKAGDGVRSPPTYCLTQETTPEAPAAVKAVVRSEDAVVVSWLPPSRSNGILTEYAVRIRVLDRGSEVKVVEGTLPPQQLHYEATGLKTTESYEARVAASTKAGRGRSTPPIRLVPSAEVPAAIINFGRTIVVPWKTQIRLPCLHVGRPGPTVEWRLGDVRILQSTRNLVVEEKSLVIESTRRSDEGNYSCHVENPLGADRVTFPVFVQVPPISPLLVATAVTSDSVLLQWKQGDSGGSPVRGFVFSYRREGREWTETRLDRYETSRLVENLDCGASYQFRLTAFNKIGSGAPGKLDGVTTKGSRPTAPPEAAFLAVNSTSAVLRLTAWGDGGCPVTRFALACRRAGDERAFLLDDVDPSRDFVLQDLSPASEYSVRVSAYNSAGRTSRDYAFVTTFDSRGAGPKPPLSAAGDEGKTVDPTDPNVELAVLGGVSLLLSLATAVGICFCCRGRQPTEMPPSDLHLAFSTAACKDRGKRATETNLSPPECAGLRSRPPRDKFVPGPGSRSPEFPEEIHPYATFHPCGQESASVGKRQLSLLPAGRFNRWSASEGARGGPRGRHLFRRGPTASDESDASASRGAEGCGSPRTAAKSPDFESDEYDSIGSDSEAERQLGGIVLAPGRGGGRMKAAAGGPPARTPSRTFAPLGGESSPGTQGRLPPPRPPLERAFDGDSRWPHERSLHRSIPSRS